jgi:hypothetical protein
VSEEPNTTENIAQTILREVGKSTEVKNILSIAAMDAPTLHVVAMPKDMERIDLTDAVDKLATKLQPWRRTGTAELHDLDSFIAWANRNKGESSALFADAGDKPSLTCIADYLGAGAPVIHPLDRDPKASHMRHLATYAFPLSPEWKIWNKVSGAMLGKGELGEFIETHAKDFLEPTPALLADKPGMRDIEEWEIRMIETARQLQGRFGQYATLMQLARNFQVNEVSNITTSLNRDTGESSIQFLNEHQQPDGAPLQIPNLFMVAIPIFTNGAHYRIPVRFRYRKSGQEVKFILTLHNPDVCLKDAVDEALARAESETALPLFRGNPERVT